MEISWTTNVAYILGGTGTTNKMHKNYFMNIFTQIKSSKQFETDLNLELFRKINGCEKIEKMSIRIVQLSLKFD